MKCAYNGGAFRIYSTTLSGGRPARIGSSNHMRNNMRKAVWYNIKTLGVCVCVDIKRHRFFQSEIYKKKERKKEKKYIYILCIFYGFKNHSRTIAAVKEKKKKKPSGSYSCIYIANSEITQRLLRINMSIYYSWHVRYKKKTNNKKNKRLNTRVHRQT